MMMPAPPPITPSALLRTACLLAICALAACAHPLDAPPASLPKPLHSAALSLQALHHEEAQRTAQLIAARALLDHEGAGASRCSERSPQVGERAAWLEAWCWFRLGRWEQLLASLPAAIAYHEMSGQLRRLCELHMMGALAGQLGGDTGSSARHMRRMRELIATSHEPLAAPLGDPFAGDMAYLAGRLAHLGLSIHPDQVRAHPAPLFALARDEYAATQRYSSMPHLFRAQSAWLLDAGDLGGAARALGEALQVDLGAQVSAGLMEDLRAFSRMATVLEQPEWADASMEWFFVHEHPHAAGSGLLQAGALPTSAQRFAQLATHEQGRLRMLRALRAMRRDPLSATSPPEAMLSTLRARHDLSALTGSGWAVAQQIGEMFAERGELAHARRYLRHAVEQVEAMRSSIPDLAARQKFSHTHRALYMSLIHACVGIATEDLTQQDYREVLQVAAKMKARGALDVLSGQRVERAPSLPAAHSLMSMSLEGAARLTSKVLRGWARPKDDAALAAPELVSALPKDAMLVEYVLGERSGYAWVMAPDGALSMRRIAGRRQLAPLIRALRETLMKPAWSAQDYAHHRQLAERLHVELVGPLQDLIVDAERLYIAPDAELHEVPFEALARPSRARQPHYMVRDHAVHYIPSVSVLAALRQRALPHATRSLLLGAPTLEQSALELLGSARAELPVGAISLAALFPELPGSRRELDSIARARRAKGEEVERRVGLHASEAALRHLAQPYQVVHIAAHGVSDAPDWRASTPSVVVSQPALLLARSEASPEDGVWTLSEILSSTLHARLVVLSGCTTGRGWEVLGEGAYGLASAFLATGSPTVMASLWSVSDRATATLMARMYAHLDADASNAGDALRRAQLDVMGSSARYTPPFYWAAFRVIGQ